MCACKRMFVLCLRVCVCACVLRGGAELLLQGSGGGPRWEGQSHLLFCGSPWLSFGVLLVSTSILSHFAGDLPRKAGGPEEGGRLSSVGIPQVGGPFLKLLSTLKGRTLDNALCWAHGGSGSQRAPCMGLIYVFRTSLCDLISRAPNSSI